MKKLKTYKLTEEIPVYVNSEEGGLNIDRVLKIIKNLVPEVIYSDVLQEIMIGDFTALENKEIDGGYVDGIIYIDSDILDGSEQDLVKNIVHEMGHVMQEKTNKALFSNTNVQTEFLDKRMRLYDTLSEDGYDLDLSDFMNLEYDEEFDFVLLDDIGYEEIHKHSSGYMIDPYAFTDLNEYIVMNFEEMIMGNTKEVSQKSSVLYDYLVQIIGS